MTVEKAVEILKANNEKRIAAIYASCKRLAIEALEKQIPKKPNKKGYPFDSDIDPLIYGCCPCCDTHMDSSKAYCDKCGQAVDWSDEE